MVSDCQLLHEGVSASRDRQRHQPVSSKPIGSCSFDMRAAELGGASRCRGVIGDCIRAPVAPRGCDDSGSRDASRRTGSNGEWGTSIRTFGMVPWKASYNRELLYATRADCHELTSRPGQQHIAPRAYIHPGACCRDPSFLRVPAKVRCSCRIPGWIAVAATPAVVIRRCRAGRTGCHLQRRSPKERTRSEDDRPGRQVRRVSQWCRRG
jgi:hypothetical protein